MGRAAAALFRRDLRLAAREGAALGTALGFYLVLVALIPLSLGPDPTLLGRLAPGVLWIGLLLSALLSLPRLFELDRSDGTLEAVVLAEAPLELYVIVKVAVHWLTVAMPLVLVAPVFGVMLNIEFGRIPALVGSMLIGSPAVSAFGALGAGLTLETRRGGVLLALLVLPLYIPTLIFGVTALAQHQTGLGGGATASLMLLGAVSLVAVALAPFATAAALRASLR